MFGESEILLQLISDEGVKTMNTAVWFFVILSIWSLYWKGISLWIAARNKSKRWFIILLILNTAGILEILYVYFFSKKQKDTDIDKEN